MLDNTAPGTKLPCFFCVRISPLQLGVVLVSLIITIITRPSIAITTSRIYVCMCVNVCMVYNVPKVEIDVCMLVLFQFLRLKNRMQSVPSPGLRAALVLVK